MNSSFTEFKLTIYSFAFEKIKCQANMVNKIEEHQWQFISTLLVSYSINTVVNSKLHVINYYENLISVGESGKLLLATASE